MQFSSGFGYEVFDFCNALAEQTNASDIVRLFHKAIEQVGFSNSIVVGIPQADQRFEHVVLLKNWPEGWFDVYLKSNFARTDPVLRLCRSSSSLFDWREAPYDPIAEPNAKKVMQQATDFGLVRGFSLPIHRPDGHQLCFSVSGARVDMPECFRPALHFMMMQTFEHLLRHVDTFPDEANPLTPKEREVLCWAGKGKSASETAEIMKITERTVNAHAGAAMTKLGANNRTQAVVRAMKFRFIDI